MAIVSIVLIRLYQVICSPYTSRFSCRFFPSCSEYAIRALQEKGFFRGGWRAARRVMRCNPWEEGGWDPPSGGWGAL